MQVGSQVLPRCVTIGGIFGETLQANGFQLSRDFRLDLPGRLRSSVLDLLQQDGHLTAKRPLSGQRFIEHGPQGVNIRADVDLSMIAPSLLGGHIGRCAHQLAADGERFLAGLALG